MTQCNKVIVFGQMLHWLLIIGLTHNPPKVWYILFRFRKITLSTLVIYTFVLGITSKTMQILWTSYMLLM